MFNAFGILSLIIYGWMRLYDWVMLNIPPFQDWKEFVLLAFASLFLFIKGIRGLLQLWFYKKKLKQDEELRQLEIEERRKAIARGDDYDENNITNLN